MTTIKDSLGIRHMSHPDPHGPPDRTPIEVGEVWENPVTGEPPLAVQRALSGALARVARWRG